jgi:hypothetical protein
VVTASTRGAPNDSFARLRMRGSTSVQSRTETYHSIVYDSDKAIHSAVRRTWPAVPIHLCEHHLYNNAKKHLREDGQEGWGNTYRTLLATAGQSPRAGLPSATPCWPSRRSPRPGRGCGTGTSR